MKLLTIILTLLISYSCKNKTEITNKVADQLTIPSLSKEELMEIVSVGNECPNGKLKATDESITEIKSFKGKLLIIDFWATWCSPCIEEAPLFNKLAEKYKNFNAEFISVSVDDDFEFWKRYVIENNWNGNNYNIGIQENDPFFSFVYSKITKEKEVMILIGLPQYVFISPSGKILSHSDLRPSKPEFELEIKKHLQ